MEDERKLFDSSPDRTLEYFDEHQVCVVAAIRPDAELLLQEPAKKRSTSISGKGSQCLTGNGQGSEDTQGAAVDECSAGDLHLTPIVRGKPAYHAPAMRLDSSA